MATEANYLRLYEKIQSEIRGGSFSKGRLPSERNLVTQFDGTRITVREALLRLEAEGVIYRLNRRGWFVAPPRIRYSPNNRSHFISIAKAQGRNPVTRVLHAHKEEVGADIAGLMVANVDRLSTYYVARVRDLDGHPAFYEEVWLNANMTPGILEYDLNQSLTEIMRAEYGIEIKRTDIVVTVVPLTGEQASQLLVHEGAMGLLITQCRYDQYGNMLEYDREYWRHDVIELDLKFSDL